MALEIFKLFGTILVNNDEANKSISKTGEEAEGLGGKFVKGIGTVAKWGAAVTAAVGSAAVAFGTLAVKTSDEYTRALNQLQAATGASDERMKELGETVKNVYGNNFGESFEDVANSVETISKLLGLQGDELENITELAIGYSDTFDVEVGESARSAKTLMDQFGISAEEAYNLMVQGQHQGLNYSDELIDSINEYSVHFSQLGLSAEDMFNVFLDGSMNGAFNLDKIGDAVKELGIKVKEGSANEALAELGFSADEVVKKFNAGGEEAREAFYQIFESLQKVDDQTKLNNLGTALMGTMYEDLGKDAVLALGEMSDGFNCAADSAKKINEIKYNSFGEAVEGIKRQVQTNIMIPLGENILPILNKFANWFANEGQQYLKSFADFIEDSMPIVSRVFDSVFNAVTGVITAFEEIFTGVVGDVSISWEDLFNNIKEKWDSYGAPVFNTVKDVISTVYENSAPIFEGIKNLFATAIDYISTYWNSIGEPIFEFIIYIVKRVSEIFAEVFPKIAEIFSGVCDTINKLWNEWLKPVLTLIGDFISLVLLPIFKFVFEQIVSNVMYCFNYIADLWTGSLKPILDGIIDFISGIFSGNWSQAWNGICSIVSGIWSGIKTILWAPIGWFLEKVGGIADVIASPFRKAGELIGDVWSSIKSVFKLPHFTIDGSFNPLTWIDDGLPSIGVEWYAKGGVMTKPTIFGMNGPNAMGGGEDGPEAIAPISVLQNYVATAVNNGMKDNIDYNMLLTIITNAFKQAINDTGMNNQGFYVDSKKLCEAIAESNDRVSGKRLNLNNRGLIL